MERSPQSRKLQCALSCVHLLTCLPNKLRCSSSQSATKKLSLTRLPPVVPIHLKRFSHSKSSSQSSKVETKIRFPLSLDLTPYTASSSAKSKGSKMSNGDSKGQESNGDPADSPKPIFELASVIVHKVSKESNSRCCPSSMLPALKRLRTTIRTEIGHGQEITLECHLINCCSCLSVVR